MDKGTLSYKTLRNSTFLLIGFVVPMFFTIFLTRALSSRLGIVEFGVFLLLNAINSFIGYIDMGFGTSVTKFAAEYNARSENFSLARLLNSALLVFSAIGILGLAVFFILGKWFLPVFNIPAQSYGNIFLVFILAGLIFLFNSLGSVYTAFLTALQRFDLITKISTGSLIVSSLGTIALVYMGYQLKAVMGLNLLLVLTQLYLTRFYLNRQLPNLGFRLDFDKAEIIKCYKFGFQTFVSSISDSCLVFLDRLFIPIFLGPAQLAFYSVPGNVALKISGVTNNLAGMFFPMAAALSGSGQLDKIKSVYVRAFRNLSVITAAMCIAIAIFAEKILLFWLGPEYAERGTGVLRILSATYYMIGLYVPLRSLLLGLGEIKILIRQSLIMAFINFVLLLILLPKFGIAGAAWAYLLSVIPMVYTFYWVESKMFNLPNIFSGLIWQYFKLLVAAVPFAGLLYFVLLPLTKSVWLLVIFGPLSVLIYPAIYYIFGFVESEDKILFKNYLLSVAASVKGRLR